MKDIFLKISGAKDEKDFYSKYPTEEAFMKKHGKAFKKAQAGWNSGYTVDPIDMEGFNEQFGQNQYSINKDRRENIRNNMNEGLGIIPPSRRSPGLENIKENLPGFASSAVDIVRGIQGLKDEKNMLDNSVQMKELSNIMLDASRTRPEQIQRRYVRPEDNITTGEELFPVYGSAKYGKSIPKGKNGMNWDFMNPGSIDGAGQKLVSNFITGVGGQNAGGDLGGGIGSAIGNAILPGIGGIAGQFQGQMIGALINRRPQKIRKNTEAVTKNAQLMGAQNNFMGLQDQNFSYMEDGGTLPMIQEDGHLDVHWGGKAESISHNPFLPGTGETVMFKGSSHDTSKGGKSGIGISYMDNPVEVEGGEPATVLNNSGEEGLVVFGNLKIPKGFEEFIGDEKAKNKKFKNYVDLLSKEEKKLGKFKDKNMEELSELDVTTSFDKLNLNSRNMNLKGSDLKLMDIAEKKERTAELQTAMNELSENKKGMKAQDGKTVPTYGQILGQDEQGMEMMNEAQYNYLTELYKKAARSGDKKDVEFFQKVYSGIAPNRAKNVLKDYDATNFGKLKGFTNEQLESNYDGIFGKRTAQYLPVYNPETGEMEIQTLGQKPVRPGDGTDPTEINDEGYNRNPVWDIASQVMPFIRPTNALPLAPEQLMGEMHAMSQNQLEPVQAQTYKPELNTPYRVSFQDMMNENNADFRNITSNTGYNPALQSMMASEKYKANQRVLGEEFRTNQGLMDNTFRENRNTLNDAQLKNLGIYDTQYTRGVQAKANTKGVAQEAISSISDKILQNRLENRTLGIYENMYGYRYDNRGRAINFNAPFVPNIPTVGTIPMDEEGKIVRDTERVSQRYDRFNIPQGSIKTKGKTTVGKTKGNRNGTILKSMKSL